MKQFALYDPKNPEQDQVLLKKWISPQEENGEDFCFVKVDDYIILYVEQLRVYPPTSDKYGQTKLIADQLEMPLKGIRWYIDAIEQKFFKSESEGGLPAHKISYEEIIAGEDLHIIRSMNAGCSQPGYDLTNSSRSSHISPSSYQSFEAADPWLFEGGLMDFFKKLADQYERGEL